MHGCCSRGAGHGGADSDRKCFGPTELTRGSAPVAARAPDVTFRNFQLHRRPAGRGREAAHGRSLGIRIAMIEFENFRVRASAVDAWMISKVVSDQSLDLQPARSLASSCLVNVVVGMGAVVLTPICAAASAAPHSSDRACAVLEGELIQLFDNAAPRATLHHTSSATLSYVRLAQHIEHPFYNNTRFDRLPGSSYPYRRAPDDRA